MFRRPHVGIIDQSNWSMTVGSTLNFCQTNVSEGKRGQDFEQGGSPFAFPIVVSCKDNARLEGPVGSRDYGLPG